MTPTQRARRSDALMSGNIKRRDLCDIIALREQRIEELEEELRGRAARRHKHADSGTDGATGWCVCGACGKSIDLCDKYCKHCGALLED